MKFKISGRIFGFTLVIGLVLTSCYKVNDSAYLDELDVTLSYYEKDFDFQQYSTFAIRDSVGLISDYLTNAQITNFYKPGQGSDQIRNYIKQKYIDLGYTYVTTDEDYDFGVNITVALIENTEVYAYPGWWWGYYDYYYWYGGYYPPYYGYPWGYVTYTYQTGTMLIEMADGESVRTYQEFISQYTDFELDNMDPSQIPQIEFSWLSLINGVVGETASYNEDRAKRGIDEAFAQSPYLKKN